MKYMFKTGFKIVFNHFTIITTLIILLMGLIRLFSSTKEPFVWSFPLEVICVAASSSVLSLIFVSKEEYSKRSFFIRCGIHFCLLNAVVLSEVFLFKWWSGIEGLFIIFGVFIFVYIGVWVYTKVTNKKTSDKINQALKKLPKNEE